MKESFYLISAAATGGVIFMELRVACLTSLKYIIMLCMFVEWVVLLHDVYTLWARPMWRFIYATQATTTCRPTPTADSQVNDAIKVPRVKNGDKKSLGVDLRIVVKRLGMIWDCDDKRQVIGSDEILGLFDVDEPSLDEVKEAFSVFDRNNDGYIDEKELQHAFSNMGYSQISVSDCRRMIDRYDTDKDAKISFTEFLKLMEDGFL